MKTKPFKVETIKLPNETTVSKAEYVLKSDWILVGDGLARRFYWYNGETEECRLYKGDKVEPEDCPIYKK